MVLPHVICGQTYLSRGRQAFEYLRRLRSSIDCFVLLEQNVLDCRVIGQNDEPDPSAIIGERHTF